MSKYRVKETDGVFTPQIWRWYVPMWKPMLYTTYEQGITYATTFNNLESAKLAIEESIEESKKPKQKPIVKYHEVYDDNTQHR